MLADPNYAKTNSKYADYLEKLPKYEAIVAYLDKFLSEGVSNNLITWSERAKKEKKARLEALAKRRSTLFKNTNQDDIENDPDNNEGAYDTNIAGADAEGHCEHHTTELT